MNRDKLERWILLKHSGELSAWRMRRLAHWLAKDAELRQFDADLLLLNNASRAWTMPGASTPTAAAVQAQLTTPADRREAFAIRVTPRASFWPTLLGATALLILGAGLWVQYARHLGAPRAAATAPTATVQGLAWEDGMDNEISELQELLTVASADMASFTTSSQNEEELIRELLALEETTI